MGQTVSQLQTIDVLLDAFTMLRLLNSNRCQVLGRHPAYRWQIITGRRKQIGIFVRIAGVAFAQPIGDLIVVLGQMEWKTLAQQI